MTRGFITIATGNMHYYKIAANLLLSYRLFSADPLPFAIIAEEENEYTALFDDVILTTEARHSFLDKFLLMKLCPYDETIFFDADSLAYGDLNAYWSFFENATDFSATGQNFPVEQPGGAWFDIDGIGDYASRVTHKSRVHMGVCFVRNSEKTRRMYDDCLDILQNYDQLHFHTCPASVDECVVALAMSMNGMLTIEEDVHLLGVYPCLRNLKAHILYGALSYRTLWNTSTENGILVHWGTTQTHEPLYRFEIACMNYMLDHPNEPLSLMARLKYKYRLLYWGMWLANVPKVIKRKFDFLVQAVSKRLKPGK